MQTRRAVLAVGSNCGDVPQGRSYPERCLTSNSAGWHQPVMTALTCVHVLSASFWAAPAAPSADRWAVGEPCSRGP